MVNTNNKWTDWDISNQQTFFFNNKLYTAEDASYAFGEDECKGCAFCKLQDCMGLGIPQCIPSMRADLRDVIYKEVK